MDFKHNKIVRFVHDAFYFYVDGFKNMTLGKTLWAVILIKLFIICLLYTSPSPRDRG